MTPTAKYFSLNRNMSINSKLVGYLAIMYLDALTIITVITIQIGIIVCGVVISSHLIPVFELIAF